METPKSEWQYFVGMWGFIGYLEYWRQNIATNVYTYQYCDECGGKKCTDPWCQSTRMCGLYGWVGDDWLFWEQR